MRSKPNPNGRYAAKLLFQFKVSGAGWQNKRRLCEERIILLSAASARAALTMAKKRGRASQHSYDNSDGNRVNFQFVGVLDLLELGVECDEDEVWYEINERLLPMERKTAIIPPERDLCAIRNERQRTGQG
ncbi:MAG TPA: DUF4288 domain-containing protein [Pirellulales bacterium]|nr:DUF4288 domain-containing protein [Pirellulales bacterium]